jgi:hypothetical protein
MARTRRQQSAVLSRRGQTDRQTDSRQQTADSRQQTADSSQSRISPKISLFHKIYKKFQNKKKTDGGIFTRNSGNFEISVSVTLFFVYFTVKNTVYF